MNVWGQIRDALERHGRCALVTVARTRGSVPREEGAAMVVTPQGFHGTIGGGTLEWRAIAEAQALLEKGAGLRKTSHALGPDLGQCCGGHVELLTEVFGGAALAEARRKAALPGLPRRRVYLFGAGHVGKALVLALAPLPFDVVWIDPRPSAFPPVMPANVTAIAPEDVPSQLDDAPDGSFAFIMSHSHALDLAIADAALRNPAITHAGLIGSATKRARFEKRLGEAGVAAQRIKALICPIGVEGIRSKEPAMIALASAAQIVQLHEKLGLVEPALIRPVGHLLPSYGREKADTASAFSRGAAMGEGGQRPDEGLFRKSDPGDHRQTVATQNGLPGRANRHGGRKI